MNDAGLLSWAMKRGRAMRGRGRGPALDRRRRLRPATPACAQHVPSHAPRSGSTTTLHSDVPSAVHRAAGPGGRGARRTGRVLQDCGHRDGLGARRAARQRDGGRHIRRRQSPGGGRRHLPRRPAARSRGRAGLGALQARPRRPAPAAVGVPTVVSASMRPPRHAPPRRPGRQERSVHASQVRRPVPGRAVRADHGSAVLKRRNWRRPFRQAEEG